MIHAPVPDDEDDWVLSYELAYRVAAIDATVCDRLVDLCGHYPCERPMVAGHDAAQRKRLGDMRRLPRDDDTEWVYRLLHGLVRDANDRVFGLELTDLVKPPNTCLISRAAGDSTGTTTRAWSGRMRVAR